MLVGDVSPHTPGSTRHYLTSEISLTVLKGNCTFRWQTGSLTKRFTGNLPGDKCTCRRCCDLVMKALKTLTYRRSSGQAAGSVWCVDVQWSLLDGCDDNDRQSSRHHHHHRLVSRQLPCNHLCVDIVPDRLMFPHQQLTLWISDADVAARLADMLHTRARTHTDKQSIIQKIYKYLSQGDYVFPGVCRFDCLSVINST